MGINPMEEEMCLVDSCTTNTILTEVIFFQTLAKRKGQVLTITIHDAMIVSTGKATIILPMGTQIKPQWLFDLSIKKMTFFDHGKKKRRY